MKKNIVSIALFLIVLVTVPVIIFLDDQNKYNPQDATFLDLPIYKKWEYIKDRLFDGKSPKYKSLMPYTVRLRKHCKKRPPYVRIGNTKDKRDTYK